NIPQELWLLSSSASSVFLRRRCRSTWGYFVRADLRGSAATVRDVFIRSSLAPCKRSTPGLTDSAVSGSNGSTPSPRRLLVASASAFEELSVDSRFRLEQRLEGSHYWGDEENQQPRPEVVVRTRNSCAPNLRPSAS